MKIVCAWGRVSLAGVLLFIGAATAWSQSGEPAEQPYTLNPGDVVSITVLEDPELDRQVLVAPDGQITMPLAGALDAEGLSPVQLQDAIQRKLRSNFVEPPSVTVSLVSVSETEDEEDKPREVYVLGEVGSPGRFEYDPETEINVLQALTLAGGLGPFAATARIQVRERVDEAEVLRLFDYEAVEDGQLNSTRDLSALADGAIIVVPERGLFE